MKIREIDLNRTPFIVNLVLSWITRMLPSLVNDFFNRNCTLKNTLTMFRMYINQLIIQNGV